MATSLGLGAGMPGGSQHGDVLSASPEDVDAKLRLIDELKSRGRHAVGSKNYRDADLLYTKAVDVLAPLLDDAGQAASTKKDLAILHSNRSLARLQMGQLAESRADAERAIELDGTYLKGHWRLGQACTALGESGDALAAFEAALKLDGSNKALKKEADKARTKVEQEKLLVMEGKFDGNDNAGAKKTAAAPRKPAPKPAAPKKKTDVVKSNAGAAEFTKSDHVRGYKVVDGKKTSFFHHEQTEEEKRLIGDITPMQISTPAVQQQSEETKVAGGTSAWNKAGTWEEKDVTGWAVDTLTASLSGVAYSVPSTAKEIGGGAAKVTRVEKLGLHEGGHASVAAVRGKKRYIYEFGLKISWELEGGSNGEDYTGTMTLPDVDGTVEAGDEYDLSEFTTESTVGNAGRMALNKHVRDGGLRGEVHKAIDGWVELFKATY